HAAPASAAALVSKGELHRAIENVFHAATNVPLFDVAVGFGEELHGQRMTEHVAGLAGLIQLGNEAGIVAALLATAQQPLGGSTNCLRVLPIVPGAALQKKGQASGRGRGDATAPWRCIPRAIRVLLSDQPR